MTDEGYTNAGCFAQALQLVIQDSILSQRYVRDILANCRRIVGHFKHTQLASSRLKADLGLPQHHLKQDILGETLHYTCCSQFCLKKR